MNRTAALARFVLAPVEWSAAVDSTLRQIPFDCPFDYVSALAKEVLFLRSELRSISRDGQPLGFFVFTREGSEMLVQAVAGHVDAAQISPDFLSELERYAAQSGFTSIRFHTMRRAIINLAVECGFRVSEVVMRKAVTP